MSDKIFSYQPSESLFRKFPGVINAETKNSPEKTDATSSRKMNPKPNIVNVTKLADGRCAATAPYEFWEAAADKFKKEMREKYGSEPQPGDDSDVSDNDWITVSNEDESSDEQFKDNSRGVDAAVVKVSKPEKERSLSEHRSTSTPPDVTASFEPRVAPHGQQKNEEEKKEIQPKKVPDLEIEEKTRLFQESSKLIQDGLSEKALISLRLACEKVDVLDQSADVLSAKYLLVKYLIKEGDQRRLDFYDEPKLEEAREMLDELFKFWRNGRSRNLLPLLYRLSAQLYMLYNEYNRPVRGLAASGSGLAASRGTSDPV